VIISQEHIQQMSRYAAVITNIAKKHLQRQTVTLDGWQTRTAETVNCTV